MTNAHSAIPRPVTRQVRGALDQEHGKLDAIVAQANALPEGDPGISRVAESIEEVEFRMQDHYGFNRSAAMHRHWHRPAACRCDGDLAEAMWREGSSSRFVHPDCPLHGRSGHRSKGVTYVDAPA